MVTERCGGCDSKAARTTLLVMLLAQDYNVAGISLFYHLLRFLLTVCLVLFLKLIICFISIYFENTEVLQQTLLDSRLIDLWYHSASL